MLFTILYIKMTSVVLRLSCRVFQFSCWTIILLLCCLVSGSSRAYLRRNELHSFGLSLVCWCTSLCGGSRLMSSILAYVLQGLYRLYISLWLDRFLGCVLRNPVLWGLLMLSGRYEGCISCCYIQMYHGLHQI